MQEFGPTDYAQAHQGTYHYATAYGMGEGNHPGVDWAVPMGTGVATPLGGTVSVVGNDHGTGYYYTSPMGNSGADTSGEFAVTLDNGDQLILGHMSNITARVGQRVNAGQLIGQSGGSDGAHVHVEYRQRQADGSYRIIDPRTGIAAWGQPQTY
jgi:murein DD-endopeptidase MepM/ murein hydrolase activator NlpD